MKDYDLLCVGRGMLDLYGDQFGGRLEEMQSYSAYVGGSAANIAIGASRLGIETAMLLRVGDDHMGRFVTETMKANGVDVSSVIIDETHPTPMCILGIRDERTFPRDLFTHDCAYRQLDAEDIDAAHAGAARALLVNGTFFASQQLAEVCRTLLDRRRQGSLAVLDIDYRPALWGLAGHGQGELAFIESNSVTERLQADIHKFDLIVGTEEEIRILGGKTDTLAAVKRLRGLTQARIIVKRGVAGCVVFDGAVPESLDDGQVVGAFPVDVLNTAGAGDAFMSGLMRGLLRGEDIETSCRIANACGALVVARHGCSDASPTWPEVEEFMGRGGVRRPGADRTLQTLYRAANKHAYGSLDCMIDIPADLEALPDDAIENMISSRGRAGLLFGPASTNALAALSGRGFWLARRLGDLQPGDLHSGVAALEEVRSWPRELVVALTLEHGRSDGEQRDLLRGFIAICEATRRQSLLDLRAFDDNGDAIDVLALMEELDCVADWWALPACDHEKVQAIAERLNGRAKRVSGLVLEEPARAAFKDIAILHARAAAVPQRTARAGG